MDRLQKDGVAAMRESFQEHTEIIESSPMSTQSKDMLILSNEARKEIPVSIEAKWGFEPLFTV